MRRRVRVPKDRRNRPGRHLEMIVIYVKKDRYDVELRMESDRKGNRGGLKQTFHLFHPESDFHTSGTDLAKMKKTFKEHIDKMDEVTWEKWIEVQVDDGIHLPQYAKDTEYHIDFEFRVFEQGLSKKGRKYSRNLDGSNMIGRWETTGHRTSKYSYVKHTPELEAALTEIGKRIVQVRQQLAELLSQKTLQQTLQLVIENKFKVLPAPE